MTICAHCGHRVYRVLNPRTRRTFLVESFTGRVACPRSPFIPRTLDNLPDL